MLFDGEYWKGFLDWLRNFVLAQGFISDDDFELLRICDYPDQLIEAAQRGYMKHEVIGKKALLRKVDNELVESGALRQDNSN